MYRERERGGGDGGEGEESGVRDRKRQQREGREGEERETGRGLLELNIRGGTWLEGTSGEMRGIESTFVCFFLPLCSSSISPH